MSRSSSRLRVLPATSPERSAERSVGALARHRQVCRSRSSRPGPRSARGCSGSPLQGSSRRPCEQPQQVPEACTRSASPRVRSGARRHDGASGVAESHPHALSRDTATDTSQLVKENNFSAHRELSSRPLSDPFIHARSARDVALEQAVLNLRKASANLTSSRDSSYNRRPPTASSMCPLQVRVCRPNGRRGVLHVCCRCAAAVVRRCMCRPDGTRALT